MSRAFFLFFQFVIVIFALSVHEAAHAWMANRLGDPTAKFQGRVTLNPLAHIDWIGTVLLPLFLVWRGLPAFGWAKPVPFNPMNLKNPRRDGMLIAIAGPASNMLTAATAIVVFLVLKSAGLLTSAPLVTLLLYLILIPIYLAVFNLIPIPPLDGSGVLEGFLRGDALSAYEEIKPYGFLILLAVIYFGLLDFIFQPVMKVVMSILGF